MRLLIPFAILAFKILSAYSSSCLLDKTFFMYYEETDWNCRAKKENYKAVYVPSTTIYHKVSYDSKVGDFQYLVHCRNRFLFAFKNFNKINLIFFLMTQFIWILIEFITNLYRRNFVRLKVLSLGLRKGLTVGIRARKKIREFC